MNRLVRFPRARRGPLAVVLAALALACAATAAEIPPPPVDATYAFVGDPLRGMDPGDPGSLFELDADFSKGMASTTKSWAMYLVSRAVDDGLIDLDDTVTLSANALIPRNHSHSRMAGPSTPAPGDQYRLDDLLIALMVDSASDGTLGPAEYLAATLDPGLASGAAREAAFVDLMNDVAGDIGLTDTEFFNPYGGDHLHTLDGRGGAAVPHRSTAREMAQWFAHAMEDSPTFRDLNAWRGNRVVTSIDGTNTHNLNGWFWGYPGLVGRKPGGNASCTNCLVGGARRIGRYMAFGYMDAPNNSNAQSDLLDYGFAVTFHPELQAWSSEWGAAKDYALANVGPTRAIAAVITEDDKFGLVTWAVNAEAGTIQQIRNGLPSPCGGGTLTVTPGQSGGPTVGGPGGIASGRGGSRQHGLDRRTVGRAGSRGGSDRGEPDDPGSRGTGSAGRRDVGGRPARLETGATRSGPFFPGAIVPAPGTLLPTPTVPHGLPGYDSTTKPLAVDLVHVGSGNLVLAVETTHGLQLLSYGLPPCKEPFLRDTLFVGSGTDPQMQVTEPGLFVLAHRDGGDHVILRTYRVNLQSGKFDDGELDTAVGPALEQYDLAGREKVFFNSHVLVAGRDGGFLDLTSWIVTSDGQIAPADTEDGERAWLVSATQVPGFGAFRDVYVVAYREIGGTLVVRLYELAVDGTITSRGGTSTTYDVQPDGAIDITSYEEGGVMIAFKEEVADEVTTLAVYSVDDDLNNLPDIDASFVVDEETTLVTGPPVIVRLPTGQAEGDFLVLERDFAEFEEPIQLRLFRSGPRH